MPLSDDPHPPPPGVFDIGIDLIEGLLDFAEAAQRSEVSPKDCLSLARKLVRVAHGQFDTSASPCSECGLNHYHNYNQAKAAERTKGLLRKLANLIDADPWNLDTK